ncbi:hypothetical protein BCR35DRAFT_310132 [Leucosporidium creatinivorum]|uniref:Uncharacterized protein n=1 Tax=Leucosporidium creatinivorum TaxID=106004 RepID=A0A1Y2D793_9BASI|nr:hypothetical protein BCR35DRAFT_310132 [Leucosporidium creatinivorum]
MKLGSSHSGGGLSFGLSHLLAEKMGAGKLVGSSLISSSLSSLTRSSFLVTRCPTGTFAQLTMEGICNCGTLGQGSTCEGYEENDRTAICVEDLRHGKRWATCGLEFEPQFEPEECPVGYVRIGNPKKERSFICQDALSPYSCGKEQVDCSASPGVLTSLCVDSVCEILMCKEGWSFRVMDDGSAECVPAKPLFYNPDA